jgi:hypothetical protein
LDNGQKLASTFVFHGADGKVVAAFSVAEVVGLWEKALQVIEP